MHAKLARFDACLPLAGTRCSVSHYGSLRRLGIGAARAGYPLERGEIIDTENNYQLIEKDS